MNSANKSYSDYDRKKSYQEDVEGNSVYKPSYPYSVFFIVSTEFCERFCFYGMRSILTLYLVNILLYSKSDATVIYHGFTVFVYFFPLIGAIISDNYLGKFRTILYVSMIYATGCILLSIASITPLKLPMREFSLIGLLLISIGTGGIKPCVSSFGGDQFVLPQQAKLLAVFFSLFYFSINSGSLVSTFLTPILREDVQCFGNDSCFPLAFGVPGILMIVSIVIFTLGKPSYKIKKPDGNICLKTAQCIGNALSTKIKSKEKKEHWLDYSTGKFSKEFVEDLKATLRVLVLYTPLPIYWALYDQQGTTWTFQAVRMDGDIGFYTILPDQFQLVNPLLILVFIPLFQYIIYPSFQKIGLLKSPLEKMTWGGLLTALAFLVSAFVSMKIEATDPVLPLQDYAQLRIYNPLSCPLKIIETTPCSIKEDLNGVIDKMSYNEILDIKIKNETGRNIEMVIEGDCLINGKETINFLMENQGIKFLQITNNGSLVKDDDISKDEESGSPYLRTITNRSPTETPYIISYIMSGSNNLTSTNSNDNSRVKMHNGDYKIIISSSSKTNKNYTNDDTSTKNDKTGSIFEISLKLGGVYTLMLDFEEDDTITHKLITVTAPNTITMLWLLPQYVIITAAEILFTINGYEFSYSQAPVTMKSVLSASFLLTDSFGNFIVIIIESAKIFDKASKDFLLYAGLMVIDMLLFAFLANRYKYVNFEDNDEKMKLDNDNNVVRNNKSDVGMENPVFNDKQEI